MMSTKQDLLSNTRHSYPYLVKTDYKFDLDKLREEMVAIEKQNGWEDMTNQSELVAGLIQGRKRLTSAFANEGGEYDDYKQMIVTDINLPDSAPISRAKYRCIGTHSYLSGYQPSSCISRSACIFR